MYLVEGDMLYYSSAAPIPALRINHAEPSHVCTFSPLLQTRRPCLRPDCGALPRIHSEAVAGWQRWQRWHVGTVSPPRLRRYGLNDAPEMPKRLALNVDVDNSL